MIEERGESLISIVQPVELHCYLMAEVSRKNLASYTDI
jgi:hypothetical protein